MQNNGDESQLRAFFKNKWVRFFIVIDILAVIAVLGVVIWNATRTATLTINIAPIDANIQIGGGTYQNGTYKMHPGTYEMVISRDGLDSKTLILNLESGSAVNVTAYLKGADDDFGFYTLRDNVASYRKLAEIMDGNDGEIVDGDDSAKKFVADYQKKYNLYNSGVLPIQYTAFDNVDGTKVLTADVTIRSGADDICEKDLCFEALMAVTKDESLIDDLLIKKGFNPEDCEIHYKFY